VSRLLAALFASALVLCAARDVHADGGQVAMSGSLNELRLGALFGLFSRDAGNRVYEGNGYAALLGGDVFAPLGDGDSYAFFVLSTDLLVLGTGTQGFFARTGGDIGGGQRSEWSGGALEIWAGYHGVFDQLGTNPDSADLGYYEQGLLLRSRLTLGSFGIEAGAAGLLGTGWIFSAGLRSRFTPGMSIGTHAEWHTVGTSSAQNAPAPETPADNRADWGRNVLTVTAFLALHP